MVALGQDQLEAKKQSRRRTLQIEHHQAGDHLDLLCFDSRRSMCQSLKNAALSRYAYFAFIVCSRRVIRPKIYNHRDVISEWRS